jgi:hypothetical protein
MTLHDGIAYLDMLAAQLNARGWTAYISMPAGRVAALSVQDPHDRAQWSDVIAAPGGATGDWWYWFSWAEEDRPHPRARSGGRGDHQGPAAAIAASGDRRVRRWLTAGWDVRGP